MKKIVVAISGSSGAIYAKVLLDKLVGLQEQTEAVGVVMSLQCSLNWELEIGPLDFSAIPFQFYEKNDFNAPFASGSAKYDTMIVCPCSMGMLAANRNRYQQRPDQPCRRCDAQRTQKTDTGYPRHPA